MTRARLDPGGRAGPRWRHREHLLSTGESDARAFRTRTRRLRWYTQPSGLRRSRIRMGRLSTWADFRPVAVRADGHSEFPNPRDSARGSGYWLATRICGDVGPSDRGDVGGLRSRVETEPPERLFVGGFLARSWCTEPSDVKVVVGTWKQRGCVGRDSRLDQVLRRHACHKHFFPMTNTLE